MASERENLSTARFSRRWFLGASTMFAGALSVPDLLAAARRPGGTAVTLAHEFVVSTRNVNLFDEVRELTAKQQEEWTVETAQAINALWSQVPRNEFDGFFERIDEVFGAAEPPEIVRFNNLHGSAAQGIRLDVERLAQCPQLAQIRYLFFQRCNLGSEGIRPSRPHPTSRDSNDLESGLTRLATRARSPWPNPLF